MALDTTAITDEACALADRWKLDWDLAAAVATVGALFRQETGQPFEVISGFRTRAEQEELIRSGRPAAPVHRSNHTVCPARAVDLWIGLAPTRPVKAILGRIAFEQGLRWGGGSPVDSGGIPSDWNHLDLGPRPQ